MRVKINCENRHETLYLTNSGYANITEDTGKKKRMRKRKERTPRKKYPEPATKPKFNKNIFASHKHPNSNSNVISNSKNLFQQTRNTFEKIGAFYSNIVNQKPKKVVIFTDSMLKPLHMKEFDKNLNGSIAHLKPLNHHHQVVKSRQSR